MMEIKITLKNGEVIEINPAVRIVVDNGYYDYEYSPHEVKSIELYEVEE